MKSFLPSTLKIIKVSSSLLKQTNKRTRNCKKYFFYSSSSHILAKDKVFPMLNKAIHQGNIWESGGICPSILDLSTRWR
jgi:hypothetical protein